MGFVMHIRRLTFAFVVTGCVSLASPAFAQYQVRMASEPATGEKYTFELSGFLWQPDQDINVSSSSLGIVGSIINAADDLGVADTDFRAFRSVLRFARKHKIRFDYEPIKYEASVVLKKDLVFNGITYPINITLDSELKWHTYQFGYEWDFLYMDRGFLGLWFGAKYTDVKVELNSPFAAEYTEVKGPIPFIGGTGRIYVLSNVSISGQLSYFNLPEGIPGLDEYDGTLWDFDVYATLNFVNNFGVLGGYRGVNVDLLAEQDSADLEIKGWYIGAVVRF